MERKATLLHEGKVCNHDNCASAKINKALSVDQNVKFRRNLAGVSLEKSTLQACEFCGVP
jgi:hypothetical protein